MGWTNHKGMVPALRGIPTWNIIWLRTIFIARVEEDIMKYTLATIQMNPGTVYRGHRGRHDVFVTSLTSNSFKFRQNSLSKNFKKIHLCMLIRATLNNWTSAFARRRAILWYELVLKLSMAEHEVKHPNLSYQLGLKLFMPEHEVRYRLVFAPDRGILYYEDGSIFLMHK